MKLKRPDILFCLILLISGTCLRWSFLSAVAPNPGKLNYGGDPCHHYDIARNIAHGRGAVTDFIFSYWFHHPSIPALTDIYPPGVHYVLALFLKFFGSGYGTARFTCLLFGAIGPVVAYFLARQVLPRGLSFFAAALVVINPVHLEHSTVVMTPVIGSVFVWLTVWSFLKFKERSIWKGMLSGWSHLCMSALPPLALAFFAGEFVRFRSKSESYSPGRLVKTIASFAVGAGLILLPWAIRTYRYFGKPFYSGFNFYPIVHSWVPMNYDTTPPTAAAFIQSCGGIAGTLQVYLLQFGRALELTCLQSLPLAAPDSWWIVYLILVLLALGIWRLVRKDLRRAIIWLTFSISFLFVTSLGSTALGGTLSTRHVIVFVPFVTVLWALGIDFLWTYANRLRFGKVDFARYRSPIGRIALALALLAFAIESWSWSINFHSWKRYNSEAYAFWWFWKKQYPELEEAAQWIGSNTPKNAVLMYGSTPQDLWGLTRRKVVIDPVYAGGNPMRAAEEAKYYGVDFLVLDSNKAIYQRNPIPADIRQAYPGMDLTPVWKNGSSTIVIYQIAQPVGSPAGL